MLEKNRRKKERKNFFIITRNSLPKNGVKTSEKIFPENTNSFSKNVGKIISEKSAKKRFLYSHEYRDKKMAGKRRAK